MKKIIYLFVLPLALAAYVACSNKTQVAEDDGIVADEQKVAAGMGAAVEDSSPTPTLDSLPAPVPEPEPPAYASDEPVRHRAKRRAPAAAAANVEAETPAAPTAPPVDTSLIAPAQEKAAAAPAAEVTPPAPPADLAAATAGVLPAPPLPDIVPNAASEASAGPFGDFGWQYGVLALFAVVGLVIAIRRKKNLETNFDITKTKN